MGSAKGGSADPKWASSSARLAQSTCSTWHPTSTVVSPDRHPRPQSIPPLSPSVGVGYVVRVTPARIGRNDASLPMIRASALNRGGRGVRSPVDSLGVPPGPGGMGGNGITPQ